MFRAQQQAFFVLLCLCQKLFENKKNYYLKLLFNKYNKIYIEVTNIAPALPNKKVKVLLIIQII
jgi:hypothetical protein